MSIRRLGRAAVALACASAAALSISAPAFADETAVGLSTDSPSSLVTFPVTNPGSAQTSSISFPMGAMDTNLVGLDYRPRSNQLYAHGSLGALYVLNPPATPGGPFTAVQVSPGLGAFPAGADTGLDFNPMADAIRVVNENDENYRFNPLNGNGGAGTAAGGKDAALNPGDPNVAAAGYTNNFDGTTSTELFDIDSGSDVLFRQNPPNAGTLELRGMLGVNTTDNAGLDVAQGSRIAYAALELAGTPGSSTLHTINLANGAATPVGAIGGGKVINSLSVVPASVIAFAVDSSAVSESGAQAQVAVVRSGAENRTATVDYSTPGGGPSGTLTFDPGQTTKLITVQVNGDSSDGPDRQVTLTLSNAGPNALIGAQGSTTLTIVDDDDRPVSPPAKPKAVDSALKLGRRPLDRATLRLDRSGRGRGRLELPRVDRKALARALARGKAGSLTLKVRVR